MPRSGVTWAERTVGHQVVEVAYDLSGDVTSTRSMGLGPDVELFYTWSDAGRLLSVDSAYGTIDYGYDAQGRPDSLTDLWNGTYGWQWGPDGLLDAVVRPDGLRTELDYSAAERLSAIATTTDLGVLIQEDQLTRDADGRITSLQDWSGSHDYAYDAKGQLVSAYHPAASGLDDEHYTYDAMGNRTEWADNPASEVVYDAQGRLVQDADGLYAYDAEGRLVETTDRVTSEVTTYTWNAFDELVRVDHPDGTSTTYAYDGLGRRIEVDNAGDVVRFGYDGGELRMVFDAHQGGCRARSARSRPPVPAKAERIIGLSRSGNT